MPIKKPNIVESTATITEYKTYSPKFLEKEMAVLDGKIIKATVKIPPTIFTSNAHIIATQIINNKYQNWNETQKM